MFKKILVGSTASFVGVFGYKYNTDNDVKRAVTLYKEVSPIIVHYRFLEQKHKIFPPTEEIAALEFSLLHDKYAGPLAETLKNLRGFYIKVGQIMANRNDVLPDICILELIIDIENLRVLEDQVPHLMNGKEAKEVISNSLGFGKFEDVFQDFDENPIGSASIGQVHKAILRKSKTPVAIKVQSPGVEELFRGDITAAKSFCKIFVPEQVILFEEIEKQFLTEFDYSYEAKNLEIIGENMKQFSSLVVVPKPYPEFSSKLVLTMEFLKGPKLIDGIRNQGEKYAKTLNKTLKELESDMRKEFDLHGLPRPYNGPSATTLELYRRSLMSKDALINTPIWVANKTLSVMNYFSGLKVGPFGYYESFIPLNSSFIMDTLLKVHGHQLLVNGLFNADTHPGNFLLLEDGRIAMIDYGQVKKINEQERIEICRLVHALAIDDRQELKNINERIGYVSKYMNPDVIYKMSTIAFDRDGSDVTEGLNIQQFVDQMYNLDPWEKTPSFTVMASRLSLLLRGCGLMMNHPVSVCKAWDGIAVNELKKLK